MPQTFRLLLTVFFVFMIVPSMSVAEGSPQKDEPQQSTSKREALRIGVDANYSLDMERQGSQWKWNDQTNDLFVGMKNRGVTDFRVRLWTKDEGPHGRAYASDVVTRTLAAGMDPYLVIFLSDDWADMMKQPVPQAWKDLSFEDRLKAVRAYSRDTVTHFRNIGLRSHLYEIGNEIDYGICGEYPGKSSKKSAEALSRRVWARSAEIIKSSQAGVLEADPDARFMLHIAHWWDPEFCIAFFQFMLDQGIRVDVAGLSYFPSSNIGGSRDMAEFGDCVSRLSSAIHRNVIVAETAYPKTRDFRGQFSRWKYESIGYPLTEDGQTRWIVDFFAFCNAHPNIESVFYWSPEWYGEGMWKGFALFDVVGQSEPSWSSFASERWKTHQTLPTVYLELANNRLFVVPVAKARDLAREKSTVLLAETKGVNVEYIRRLESLDASVDDYSIRMKSTLQKNLALSIKDQNTGSIVVSDGAVDPDVIKLALKDCDARRIRVVLVCRESNTAAATLVRDAIREAGFISDLHPLPDDKPLVFGMSISPD